MTEPPRDAAGREQPRFETLTPDDLPRLWALHQALHAGTSTAGLFARETEAFFARHLADAGMVIGLFDAADTLVGYTVLGFPAPDDPENFGWMLELGHADLARVAHLDGTGLSPAWRGQGLQRALIDARLRLARAHARTLALATVAPGNRSSLTNALRAGLEVVALRAKYDSVRFIMRRDLADSTPAPAPDGPVVPLSDLGGHRATLADGWIGTRMVEDAGGHPALAYRAPASPDVGAPS
jgi:GNAT superfamily N-acetyltransferase